MIILTMKKLFLIISLLLIGSWVFAQEATKVKACFDGYKAAVMDMNGQEAFTFINKKTKDYYEDILAKALDADSMAVEKMNLADKFTIIQLRLILTAEKIKKMDAERFFIFAVKEGLIGKASVEHIEMGDISVDGNQASGKFISRGKPADFSFSFDKEQGNWKLDLTSLFPYSAQALKLMIERGKYEENDFLLRILSSLVPDGKKLGMNLWHPMESGN